MYDRRVAGKRKPSRKPRAARRPFPVVGVGASAGGLQAFSELLAALPASPSLAIIFVQHLDPKRHSMLPQLLARAAPIRVEEVHDGMPVRPDHVYVVPADRWLAIRRGKLRLLPRPPESGLAIDSFFRSLAEDQGQNAIGVVLSGTGADGAAGLGAIRAAGGVTFAQEETSARFPAMPHAAIDSGNADLELPPRQIAELLSDLALHPDRRASLSAFRAEQRPLAAILALVRQVIGVDFEQYRTPLIRRRIQRRMALLRLNELEPYLDYLRRHKEELEKLGQDLLIAVTRFFRDPEAWEALVAEVAAMLKQRSDGPLRAWVAGCGTGEEAYTLAIVLMEQLSTHGEISQMQIFATDASDELLARARRGVYPQAIGRDLTSERLRRFFRRGRDGTFQVIKPLRDACVFARHDLLRDPPFPNLDLITCRNVLIYLKPPAQRRLTATFHYALRPQGLLMLGTADGISGQDELFQLRDRKHRIYAPQAAPRRPHEFLGAEARPERRRTQADEQSETAAVVAQHDADRILLMQHTPAGAVINAHGEVLQFRGRADQFLAPSAGKASLSIYRLAKPPLAAALHLVLDQAKKTNAPAQMDGVPADGEARGQMRIEAIPLEVANHFLVLFHPSPWPPLPPAKRGGRAPSPSAAQREIARLEREAQAAREALRLSHEAHEAHSEEWMATQEEALSANEELQSINEELETSKEELQSSNEELTTVNDELRSRNHELNQLTGDLSSLMDSLDVPMVMLDGQFRIRRFTPAADEIFYLVPTDLSRPIDEIKTKVELPDLRTMAAEVLVSGKQAETTVTHTTGRVYLLHIKPYRNLHNQIEGVVLLLLDTTLRREAERNRRERAFAESVVVAVPVPLAVLEGTRIQTANAAFIRLFAPELGAITGQQLARLPGWDRRELQARIADLPAATEPVQLEWEGEFGTAGRRLLRIIANAFQPDGGAAGRLTLLSVQDLTEQRREEQRLRAFEKLTFASRMAAALAHEINNPLEALTNLLYVAEREPALPPHVAEYLGRAKKELGRVAHMTRDALGLFRDTNVPETVALPALFVDLQALFSSRIQSKQIELRIEAEGEPAALWVSGPPGELRRLFANLMANALDASPPRSPLRVRLRAVEGGVLVIVADRGAGISAAGRSRVFEPFYSTKGNLGTGLGLWVAAEIVKRHGGWIRLHSLPAGRWRGNSGTAVGVWLPRKDG